MLGSTKDEGASPDFSLRRSSGLGSGSGGSLGGRRLGGGLGRGRDTLDDLHVLLGALAPQRGIGPEQLEIERLTERLEGVEEVILATNPNVEGEATALYIARLLAARNIPSSRLAFGLPVGGDLDYIDEVTLARSLIGRQRL